MRKILTATVSLGLIALGLFLYLKIPAESQESRLLRILERLEKNENARAESEGLLREKSRAFLPLLIDLLHRSSGPMRFGMSPNGTQTITSNRSAELALKGLKVLGQDGLSALVSDLTNTNPWFRLSAATAIGGFGKAATSAVPNLIEFLKPEAEVFHKEDTHGGIVAIYDSRSTALLALEKIGDSAHAAIPYAIVLLSDSNLCSVAASTLARVHTNKCELAELLASELGKAKHLNRSALAYSLGELGPAASNAIPMLSHMANGDEDRSLRETARSALRKIEVEGKGSLRAN